MKLNSKIKPKQLPKKQEHFKPTQCNNYIEIFQGKKTTDILPRRLFSPEISNKEILFMKSFNNKSKKTKPKCYSNSSINNSTNSIHIECIMGQNNKNQFQLEKRKYQPKNIATEIERSDYLRTEPTPTSTANTTKIDSMIHNKKYSQQKSYKTMIENMVKNKYISASLKTMDVYKNRNTSSYKYTPSSKLLYNNHHHHHDMKDKSSFFFIDENTIDKHEDDADDDDANIVGNSITYKDLIHKNYQLELSIDVLKKVYNDYPNSIEFNKQIGYIKGYGVNTYKGLFKKDNEDRVSIIQNVPKPKNYKDKWPSCFLLGVYDGHGGKTCANYLKDHLLNSIVKNRNFPNDPITAIEKGFEKVDKDFLYEKCFSRSNSNSNSHNDGTEVNNQLIDSTGSCAIVIVIIDKICYIANLGDSRALVSLNKGKSFEVLSIEHSTSNIDERKRIESNGGSIYQTKISLNQFIVKEDNQSNLNSNSCCDQILYGPDRIMPGHLSVCRSIGDPKSKLSQFGGKSNVIISRPSIISYEITSGSDFIILGSDGIFEQMTNKEMIDAVWLIKKNSHSYSKCVDMIIKTSLARNAIDNLTAVIIDLKQKDILTTKDSIEEMQLELDNIYETIDPKHYHRKQIKSPGIINTSPYSVKKIGKNKHLSTLN